MGRAPVGRSCFAARPPRQGHPRAARERRRWPRHRPARGLQFVFQLLVFPPQALSLRLRPPQVLFQLRDAPRLILDDLLRVTRRRRLVALRHESVMPDSRAQDKRKPQGLGASMCRDQRDGAGQRGADPLNRYVRFKVKPVVWLPPELSIPALDDVVWTKLSFTKNQSKGSTNWAARVRGSLSRLNEEDAAVLETVLLEQNQRRQPYHFDRKLYEKFVDEPSKVAVVVPTEESEIQQPAAPAEVRESLHIQALLADIGTRLGFQVWIPRSDRTAVLNLWKPNDETQVAKELPLPYDADTNKTIEQIDMLWLKNKRSIVRAFEVEHTTSIYSGILRMADLLALQPNIMIKLHIVAPIERKAKVFEELRRPVFAYLENGPLSERCSYLLYDSLRSLLSVEHLSHLRDDDWTRYQEFAEDAE